MYLIIYIAVFVISYYWNRAIMKTIHKYWDWEDVVTDIAVSLCLPIIMSIVLTIACWNDIGLPKIFNFPNYPPKWL